jgi:hypothetical protein
VQDKRLRDNNNSYGKSQSGIVFPSLAFFQSRLCFLILLDTNFHTKSPEERSKRGIMKKGFGVECRFWEEGGKRKGDWNRAKSFGVSGVRERESRRIMADPSIKEEIDQQ